MKVPLNTKMAFERYCSAYHEREIIKHSGREYMVTMISMDHRMGGGYAVLSEVKYAQPGK